MSGRGKDGIMPDNHCMIDIETMGTGADAAIITIGACMFDPRGHDNEESLRDKGKLFGPIDFGSNEKAGRSFDADTIKWWLQQSEDAQRGLIEGSTVSLSAALTQFVQWVNSYKPAATAIWAKDPDFDCVIMKHACAQHNKIWPWKFWESKAVRTALDLAYPPGGLKGDFPTIGVGVAHNAVDDAIRQCLMIQHVYHVLDA